MRRWGCALLLAATIVAMSATAGPLAFIGNQGSDDVSVVDIDAMRELARIPVGKGPAGVAASAAAGRVFVTTPGSNGLSVIDIASRREVARLALGQGAVGVAVSPDGRRVYVSDWFGARLLGLDAATLAPLLEVPLGAAPAGLEVSADGATVWVAERDDNRIAEVDVREPARARVVRHFAVGEHPFGLLLDAVRQRLYVLGVYANDLTVIDLAAGRELTRIAVGRAPYHAALLDGGRRIAVSNQRGDSVSLIDADALRVVQTLEGFGYPEGIASHAGILLVVNWMDDTLALVDATSGQQRATLPLGQNPRGFGAFVVVPAADGTPLATPAAATR
jgi:YVTN family beta-propeller protein